jgi:poly-beta-1,6-N-acetyl-D-glucosamine synthase
MTWVLLALTLGVNLLFWTTIGALRWATERTHRARPVPPDGHRIRPDQVAVLIAAHNEELGVAATVTAAHALVPPGNVFVVSDGSSDQTVHQAQQAGASVYDLHPNRGKAGALAAGIEHFALPRHFEVVMLLDADTAPAPDYLATGLPPFDDPDVVAVAGRAATVWERGDDLSVLGQCLRAYRERLYVTFQLLFKYGQASRLTNAVTIVPGFASMYRTRILDAIDIAAPGLAIEDFNMTFEVHVRRLGRIAFHPRAAIAYTQDPHNLRDYTKQISRWSLGFWQTVRRHGLHHGRFWYLLGAFIAELLTSSVLFALLGPALLLTTTAELWASLAGTHGPIGQVAGDVIAVLPPHDILVGVVVPDYVLTVLVAAIQRRPAYLLLGLGFVPLRCLDAWLCLRSLWRTRSAQSVGTWTSPQRRTPTGSPVLSTVQATSPPPATPPPAVPSPAPRIADGSPLPIPYPRPRQQQPAPALTHASPWEHLGRIPDAKACPDCPWQSMAGG